MAKENFFLSDSQYNELQIKCLKPWLECESQNRLLEILSIIHQCWSIPAVLGELRLVNSVEASDSKILAKEGRLSGKLRCWMDS